MSSFLNLGDNLLDKHRVTVYAKNMNEKYYLIMQKVKVIKKAFVVIVSVKA